MFKWKLIPDTGGGCTTSVMRLPNGYLFRTLQYGQLGRGPTSQEQPRPLTSTMTFVPSDEEWEDLK